MHIGIRETTWRCQQDSFVEVSQFEKMDGCSLGVKAQVTEVLKLHNTKIKKYVQGEGNVLMY